MSLQIRAGFRALTPLLFTVLVAAAPDTVAESWRVLGQPFPLTNTRYAAEGGYPVLQSNGRELMLFWQKANRVRVAPVVPGQQNVGASILEGDTWGGSLDAIRMGANFVIADSSLQIRMLDSNAEPIGQVHTIDVSGWDPALAHDERRILLVYRSPIDVRTVVLGPTGAPETGTDRQLIALSSGPISYAVASNGSGFVVLLESRERIEVVFLDSEGRTVSQRTLATQTLSSEQTLTTAIASDGRDYLVAWSAGDRIDSAVIRADETVEPVFTIESTGENVRALSMNWSDSAWTLARATDSGLLVLNVDLSTKAAVVQGELVAQTREKKISLLASNGRAFVAWARDDGTYDGQIEVWDVAGGTTREAAWAASWQGLTAVASTPSDTLVAWNEDSTIRAGIRRHHDGRWIETEIAKTEIARPEESLHAVSDGRDFLVFTNDGTGFRTIHITERITASSIGNPAESCRLC